MKRGKVFIRIACFVLLGLLFAFAACAGSKEPEKDEGGSPDAYYPVKEDMKTDGQYFQSDTINFPDYLWDAPKSERFAEWDRDEVKAYFIESLEGEQVFCYVGIPSTASAENPVPGIVLVHGATGTAFADWVEYWVNRGYAAIAMDTEGKMPALTASTMNPAVQDSVKPHGPINKAFTDSSEDIEDQWAYHALAAVIAGNSFLRTFEEVDLSHIGICGVSYGAFLTCHAVGLDDRYVFAVPVYGCLGNAQGKGEFGTYINSNSGAQIWDSTEVLKSSRTPTLFVNNPNDQFFSPDSIARSVEACKYGAVSFLEGFTHGHSQCMDVKEIEIFADSLCKGGTPLVRIMSVTEENGSAVIAVPAGVEAKVCTQYYTDQDELNGNTAWLNEQAQIAGDNLFFSTESFKTHYYLNVLDSRGCNVSVFVR